MKSLVEKYFYISLASLFLLQWILINVSVAITTIKFEKKGSKEKPVMCVQLC